MAADTNISAGSRDFEPSIFGSRASTGSIMSGGRSAFRAIGAILRSSDYPHTDSTWPRSRRSIGHDVAGASTADRVTMTCTNVAKLHGFKLNGG